MNTGSMYYLVCNRSVGHLSLSNCIAIVTIYDKMSLIFNHLSQWEKNHISVAMSLIKSNWSEFNRSTSHGQKFSSLKKCMRSSNKHEWDESAEVQIIQHFIRCSSWAIKNHQFYSSFSPYEGNKNGIQLIASLDATAWDEQRWKRGTLCTNT